MKNLPNQCAYLRDVQQQLFTPQGIGRMSATLVARQNSDFACCVIYLYMSA